MIVYKGWWGVVVGLRGKVLRGKMMRDGVL